ncbi:hypothetical protein NJL88_29010 [Streptomyces sp. DK15]|uniref:hypothetical protein n=1 Tax=Streptomyces sp. DK15 TaxID=2957499 RepID=UPI0029AA68B9|nr:hypothetical protein [Streptomyces sp. DK15]MDX2394032.1 hypothetical protein [Streptomyces sp. DK15]
MREILGTASGHLAEGSRSQTYTPPESGGGNAEGWAALLSVVAQLVNALLGWLTNKGDLVCERTIGISRDALTHYFAARGRVELWDFDGGGGGRHRLWLYGSITPWQIKPRYRTLSDSTSRDWTTAAYLADRRNMGIPAVGVSWPNDWISPGILFTDAADDQLLWGDITNSMGQPVPGARTTTQPAGAWYDDKVYCVYTDLDDKVYWTVRAGTTWSAPAHTGWDSQHAPALAVHNNTLYCAHTGLTGDVWLATFNGTHWDAPTRFGGWETGSGPALTSHAGQLYCAHRGMDNRTWHASSADGSSWSESSKTAFLDTYDAPALASFGTSLFIGERDLHRRLPVHSYGGGSWAQLQTQVDNGYGPVSLTTHAGKLFAFYA